MIDSTNLAPGFVDPVMEAQRTFRAALAAMSRPGRIHAAGTTLEPPSPLHAAAAAFCLALADHDTPVWLAPAVRNAETEAFLRFHCGCPIAGDPGQAAFAVCDAAGLPALDSFATGDDAYPETSTTVVVQLDGLSDAGPLSLTGPGIEEAHRLGVDGLRDGVWSEWADNRGLFPCGIDLVPVHRDRMAAIPRTTTVSADRRED